MSGDEMVEQDDMLQFAPEVKRVPLSIKDNGGIVVIRKASPTGGGLVGAGGLVGTIDLSAPKLDHWSDLLPAPQPAPFITFYPDGDETKGIALSDDHFSPPRYDALPLGFVSPSLSPNSLPPTPSRRGGVSAAGQKASPTGGGLEGAGGKEGAEWVNFFTGERMDGGRWYYDVEVPLDQMPVFVRPGAEIPFYPDDVDSTDDIDLTRTVVIKISRDYKGTAL